MQGVVGGDREYEGVALRKEGGGEEGGGKKKRGVLFLPPNAGSIHRLLGNTVGVRLRFE